ncbi:MAG: ABC transporter ATP-binding protein [Bacteroidales bacterium]|jgi:ABC-type Fe3+/spermidine/putrescine transport system ATPase subunit|nr:ABC transporter ATP-binding protein [Bacteroidales bacterium]HOL97680.1 ABC transporter ATP-binding protein [Bacteroidales bacterium]HOM37246.1 ABC transporter ATP-binding protein [Bacteroidales bacterium]HPD24807.1 ABC transporter ATP-binding protein [Bacteroidales bacterium]HRT00348.1 ABC transporter ATP-binding protein [Bacteroidales bacterium]
MLDLNNISYKIGNFSLKNVNLKIKNSEYHVLIGPSGSGKTLLLNIIAGFIKPSSGNVIFNNIDITKLPPEKRNISYLLQNLALFPHLNVYQNVYYSLKFIKLSSKEKENLVRKYMQITNIEHLEKRYPLNLSGGEKQRVALARCLAKQPSLLLLDEPFSAIDTLLKTDLKSILKKIKDTGVGILHVTHDPAEAINLADKISVIENGNIVSSKFEEINQDVPLSNFMAKFFGFKNFYQCKYNDENTVEIVDSENYNRIVIEKPTNFNHDCFVYIPPENIIVSETKLLSSARYNLTATVISVTEDFDSVILECDAGISISAKISKNSYIDLNISPGKKVWMSFKVSNLNFI